MFRKIDNRNETLKLSQKGCQNHEHNPNLPQRRQTPFLPVRPHRNRLRLVRLPAMAVR